LEPDDRASQRAGKRNKRAARGPAAAAGQPPERPERKAGGSGPRPQPERGKAGKPEQSKPRAPRPEARKSESGKPQARKAEASKAKAGPKASAAKPKPQAEKRQRQRGDDRRRSKVDAMGQDKHRKVVGQRYALARSRQFLYYGLFIAFVVAAYFGLKTAVDQLDKAPAHDPAKAPWAQPGAPQGPLGGFEPKKADQKGPTHFQ
jgi:hypothetical protein